MLKLVLMLIDRFKIYCVWCFTCFFMDVVESLFRLSDAFRLMLMIMIMLIIMFLVLMLMPVPTQNDRQIGVPLFFHGVVKSLCRTYVRRASWVGDARGHRPRSLVPSIACLQ